MDKFMDFKFTKKCLMGNRISCTIHFENGFKAFILIPMHRFRLRGHL